MIAEGASVFYRAILEWVLPAIPDSLYTPPKQSELKQPDHFFMTIACPKILQWEADSPTVGLLPSPSLFFHRLIHSFSG